MTRNKRKFLQILLLQLALWCPLKSFHLNPRIKNYQILTLRHSPVLLPPPNQLLPIYPYPKHEIHRIQNASKLILPILPFLPLTPKPWNHPLPPNQVTSKSVKESESLGAQWDGSMTAAITPGKNISDTDITSEAGETGPDITTMANNVQNGNFSSIQDFDIKVIVSYHVDIILGTSFNV